MMSFRLQKKSSLQKTFLKEWTHKIYFFIIYKFDFMGTVDGQKQNWLRGIISEVKSDLKLRRVLLPLRTSEFNPKIKKEDKLNVKWNVFTSMFILFNTSLLSLYFTMKGSNAARLTKAPIILACFSILAYKLQVEWISREIIRKCELSSSEVAYFTRKMLLQECGDNRLVSIRYKMLAGKNKQYEQIYTIQ